MKIAVAVLFGGKSVEHEVSVISAVQAMNSLNADKYDVIPVYMTKSGGEFYTSGLMTDTGSFRDIPSLISRSESVVFLKKDERTYIAEVKKGIISGRHLRPVDVILPVVHGTNVEDGTLAGFFRIYGVPFAGCDILSSAVGMDKYATKVILRDAGINVLDCICFSKNDYGYFESVSERIESSIGYPVIIKPVNLGSSVGISKVRNKSELEDALDLAFRFSDRVLAERAVENIREINCAVIGDRFDCIASECEEPLGRSDILSYEDKYMGGGSKSSPKSSGMAGLSRRIPAEISDELRTKVRELSVKAFCALGCSGVSRIDYIIDADTGELFLNEINTIPGSLAFYLFEPVGIKYPELLDRLVSIALKHKREEDSLAFSFETNILSLTGGKLGSKNS
ncbi:MAG: D-alanine--D-alanine ligase [Clostridia bacterium]|nr:D-alanine--D-alanine ligase [Clostridia bacterium]